MQIELILDDGQGEPIVLPPEFALDDYELRRDIPGVVVPGRAGRIVYSHLQRLEPKVLRASCTMRGATREEADRMAEDLRGKLIKRNVMWLKRNVGDERFIRVRCNSINGNFHRGRFLGSLFTLNVTFQADDPHWYASDRVFFTEEVEFEEPLTLLDFEYPGSAECNPIIWFRGPCENPKLYNYLTGLTLQFNGQLTDTQIVIFDTEYLSARLVGDVAGEEDYAFINPAFPVLAKAPGISVLNQVNISYLVHGFPFLPGVNRLEVFDDLQSLELSVVYRERWV